MLENTQVLYERGKIVISPLHLDFRRVLTKKQYAIKHTILNSQSRSMERIRKNTTQTKNIK